MTVILDNESHTFAGGTSAAIAGTATVNVYAYKGATAIAPAVTKANIGGLPTGMSVQSVTNDSTNKKSTIVFAVTTSMVTRSGMVTIPVVADGKTFNKEFSYSLALQGTKGDKGDTGDRGATWYAGTGITGTSTTAKVFSGSGVSSAIVGDHYLNTSTQNVYRCTVAGAASTAKWVYEQNIKGEQGTQGVKGDTGDTCYFHIKYSNDGGATFTGNSGEDAGSYIGTYSDNTEADSTSVSSYKWVKIEGDDGTSVTVSSIKYAVSTTESQPADSAFTYNSVPTVAEGRWLWTLTTYSNGSKAYTAHVPWAEEFDPADPAQETPENQYLTQERSEELQAALMRLTERERKILEMTYWLNMKSNEVGEALGLAPSSVRVALRQAREKLRKLL